MSSFINLKKLTSAALLSVLMTGSLIVEPAISDTSTAPGQQNKKACKNNNGIGNNYDIDVTLPSGEVISIRIDPGNKGQMNKFAGYLAVEKSVSANTFNTEIKPQIIDAEMRANKNNTVCTSGGSGSSSSESSASSSAASSISLASAASSSASSSMSSLLNFATTSNSGTSVSVELVLSVDVSSSVDSTEFALQQSGYQAAFEDPEVIAAIKKLPNGLAVNMQFWADSGNILETGWYHLTNDASINSFVTKFMTANRNSGRNKIKFGSSGGWTTTGGGTDIKLAIDSAKNSLLNNSYNGDALVVDVSGDGVSDDTPYSGSGNEDGECPHDHFCPPLEAARDAALAAGITINGLPIVNNQNTSQLTHEIDKHYEQLVIVGEDSFIEVANDFGNFATAAKKKILFEISETLVASAVNDGFSTDEDSRKTGNVLTNDKDPGNIGLSVNKVNGSASNVGQKITLSSGAELTVNSNGSFTYDPNSKFEQLNDGQSQLDSFTYSINDGIGGVSTATVSMNIAGVFDNTPPTAVNDTATTRKNQPVTISVLLNDSDPEDPNKEKLKIVGVSGSKALPANDRTQIEYQPETDYSGTDSFTYTIQDEHGGTDTATVTVTVSDNGLDAVDDTETTNKNQSVTIDVLNNDNLPDGTENITISVNSSKATVVDGKIQYQPQSDYTGTDFFSYTIKDENGAEDTANVSVEVINSVPSALNDTAETDKNQPVTIDVLNNDSDPDPGDTDTLTIVDFTDSEQGGTIEIVDGEISYDPPSGYDGTDSFQYTIKDSSGAEATATVTVNISHDNRKHTHVD